MFFLGRIITKNKNLDTFDFIDVTSDVSKIDDSTPTLIIGRSLAESIYGKDKIHLLDKKICDNVYWTFSKLEKRSEYDQCIDKFITSITTSIFNNVKYVYFNIFTKSFSCIKNLIKYVDNDDDKIFYLHNRHLYMLCNNTIVGLSLIDTEYIGICDNKILNKIKSNRHNKIIYNDFFIDRKIKNLLNNCNYIIPYMHQLYNI